MKSFILTFILSFMGLYVTAQTYEIKGTVTDASGEPLPGVTVLVKNTTKGASTDFDGIFTIANVNQGDVLVFSYVGFANKEIVITNSNYLNVQLQEDTQSLDEVVVVGYGTQRKELVSGAFSSIDAEKITESSPARLEEALKGNSAGVQVTSNSGSPGAELNIRIRGITTNGNNRPLVIVDGVNIGDDLSIIDPNDIEKMDIIKDASTAIYGVQGANGVILITTKKGRRDVATKFSYNTYYALQERANTMELMNATEYAGYINETELADGNALPYPNIANLGIGTNWQNELFETAPMISHSLSATGGSEKVTYSFSGSLFDQEGVIAPDKSNFKRWTLKNNLSVDLTEKLKLNTLMLYTNTRRKAIPEGGRGSALYYALNASPLASIYDGNDSSSPSRGFAYIPVEQGQEIVNPMAVIYNTNNEIKVDRFTGKLEFVYDVIEELKLTSRLNFNYADVRERYYNPLSYYGFGKVVNSVSLTNGEFDLDTNNDGDRDLYSTVSENSQHSFDYTWESFMNYDKSFGDHNFDVLLGTSIRSENWKGNYASGFLVSGPDTWENAYLSNTQSYIYDEYIEIDDSGSTPVIIDDSIRRYAGANTAKNEDRWFSVFGRLQYDFQSKYLLSAMVRRDASTRFGPNNRVGYFPSVSAGWVVSNEDFFNNNNFINKLKLRGSWGITGNDKIGSYGWIGFLQGTTNSEASYSFGNSLVYGNAIGALSNLDLKWEQNYQTNFGVDIALLSNKLDITFDWYEKKTEDLLLVPEISGLLGAWAPGSSAPIVNAGTIRNRGVDLSVNFNHNFTDDFKVSLGYNLTSIKNETLEVNNAAGFISSGLFSLSQNTSRFQTGLPIGAFYGLKTDGVFQNQAEIDALAVDTNNDGILEEYQPGAQPGDIKYVDIDGDGVVEFGSSDDQTMIGKPIPDVTMGLNVTFDYKSFDLSTSLYASLGNDVARSYERFLTYSNKPRFYLDRWVGEGTSNTVPRASTTASNNLLFSDFYVEDGSYLRVQNIQLGYELPETALEKIGVDKFRLYFSVNNAFTFTDYKGFNPDVSNSNPSAAGVDLGQYPIMRSFITGVNLSF